MFSSITSAVLLLTLQFAAPASARPSSKLVSRALNDTISQVQIHESCNSTERELLQSALKDTFSLVETARDYVVEKGPDDPVYKRYFGNSQPFVVAGIYDQFASGKKDALLFRCDNPDGNCGGDNYYGHWRGVNASSETVICPLSYTSRKFNDQWCEDGYTVAGSSASFYFSSDLLHRLSHVPTINREVIGHYADDYADCLALALTRPHQASYNTHTLQYFANEVFALKAKPGVGCTGTIPEIKPEAVASTTTSASGACHTHADGEVHC